MKRFVAFIVVAALLLLMQGLVAPPLAIAQCSMCQASLANSENGGGIIAGFRQGIGLLLLVMTVLGGIGWAVVRRARKEFAISKSQHRTEVSVPNSCLSAEHSAGR